MKLGCIGDDFTGSSDLANTLAKEGMRTVQYVGTPTGPADTGVEAGVEAHPLTPMTDPDLRRWLARQTTGPVGHVAVVDVLAGPDAIAAGLAREEAAGRRLIVVDAIRDADLRAIGQAARDLTLVTGGSGVAMGLPANFGCTPGKVPWRGDVGPVVALSGSCSRATRAQVVSHAARNPAREIVVEDVIEGRTDPAATADWLLSQAGVPLVYSSAEPDAVAAAQTRFGPTRTAAALEGFFADVARAAVARGAARVITAGGETSGAVVEGLALSQLTIGPEIDPGVPALRARDGLTLALKSGNFGAVDFFEKAAAVLAART